MHQFRKAIFIFAMFSFSWHFLQGQDQDKAQSKQYYELAKEMLASTKALDDARDLYVTAADTDTTNLQANFEAGNAYIQTINRHLANKYFTRVYRQKPGYRFDLEYWIGFGYHNGLEFDNAIDFYTRYKNKITRNPNYAGKDKIELKDVERRLDECKNGKDLVANKKPFSIVNLGSAINSEFEDYAPVVNPNETEIIFTTRRREGNINQDVWDDNKPYEDIFISTKEGSTWSAAKNIGTTINSEFNNSNLTLSPNGNTLFIYNDGEGNGDILFSERQPDGTWSEAKPLPGSVNSSFRESSASITKDENTLYFASERPGGLGGSDIYSCTKDSHGAWTRIKNLGEGINTEYDDEGPFIDIDGKTLYFSSMGRNGMGGYDLFKATLISEADNQWSEPENMGYPINTPDNDIFIARSSTANRFYYASVREDGIGYSDIYMVTPSEDVKKPEPIAAKEPTKKEIQPWKFYISLVDSETKQPVDAAVLLEGKDKSFVKTNNAGKGKYEFDISATTKKDYLLYLEADGYVFENITLPLKGASEGAATETRTIQMRKIKVGVVSVLRNIYFNSGQATFKKESYDELNKLLSMMQGNEQIKVEIGGHTDNIGGTAFNKQLSKRRADAVKKYLASKGIAAARVTSVGYGENKPLATNDDELEGRELNRRVEFIVTGN